MLNTIQYQKEKIELWAIRTFIELMDTSPRFQNLLRRGHQLYQSTRQAWPDWHEWLWIALVFSACLFLGYVL